MTNGINNDIIFSVGDTITGPDNNITSTIAKIEEGVVTVDYDGTDNKIKVSELIWLIAGGKFTLTKKDGSVWSQ